jgi:hypothetical protein
MNGWITLLKYENISPKNCLPLVLSPSPKKGPKKAKFLQIVVWAPKIFFILFIFWFCIENRLSKNQ